MSANAEIRSNGPFGNLRTLYPDVLTEHSAGGQVRIITGSITSLTTKSSSLPRVKRHPFGNLPPKVTVDPLATNLNEEVLEHIRLETTSTSVPTSGGGYELKLAPNPTTPPRKDPMEVLRVLAIQGLSTTEVIKEVFAQEIKDGVSHQTLRLRLGISLAALRKKEKEGDEVPKIITVKKAGEDEGRYYVDNDTIEDPTILTLMADAKEKGIFFFRNVSNEDPRSYGNRPHTLGGNRGYGKSSEKPKAAIFADISEIPKLKQVTIADVRRAFPNFAPSQIKMIEGLLESPQRIIKLLEITSPEGVAITSKNLARFGIKIATGVVEGQKYAFLRELPNQK